MLTQFVPQLSHVFPVIYLKSNHLCYPENDRKPFYDMLSGKLTRIVVRIDLEPIKEELHGDYVNDKGFKRRFQLWLNALWNEKDKQIEKIKAENKNAGQ